MSGTVQFEVPPIVPADPEANVADLLVERVKATPDRALFAVPDGAGWRDITAAEFERQVIALAKGLVAAGIEPGDKIAFIARTTYQWTLVDFAIFYAGAVMVPVYETSSPSQIQWALSDSGAIACIVESLDHGARLDEARADLPLVRSVWSMHLGDLDKLVDQGKDVADAEIERRRSIAKGSDLATLIYTSGSTGRPKGCVLTHSNFVELSRNSAKALREVVETPGASTLLFITTAHVFARFISILDVHAGVKTGTSRTRSSSSPPSARSSRPSSSPSRGCSRRSTTRRSRRPRRAARARSSAGPPRRSPVEHSKRSTAGKVPFGTQDQVRPVRPARLQQAARGDGRTACATPSRARRRWASGSGHFFRSLGVLILEGYGLTETTAPATVNLAHEDQDRHRRPRAPGRRDPKIAEDGEIDVRGHRRVQGATGNNPEATAEAFDGDWFKTGDIGTLDDEGFLTITGRKKEIIVTAGGKNVAPAVLEDPIRANPLVEPGGRRRRRASRSSPPSITLDPEMLPTWLGNNGEPADMSLRGRRDERRGARRGAAGGRSRRTRAVSRAESIRKFTILAIEFTEASGHLTPKMSIKRNVDPGGLRRPRSRTSTRGPRQHHEPVR